MSVYKDLFHDYPRSLPNPKLEETRYRHNDPDTSQQAARAAAGMFTAKQMTVLRQFRDAPNGLTDLELQTIIGDGRSTYRTRRSELVEAGLLQDSGRREKQEGSNRIVWEVTDAGRLVKLDG